MIARTPSRRDRRRGATSLIELIAAVTLTAVLFGTTATLTALLFRLERLGRDELAATLAEGRLASEFRADVHGAARLGDGDGDDLLVLDGPEGETISYRVERGTLVRRRRLPDGTDVARSERLPAGAVVRLEREDGGPRLALVLETPARPNAGAAGGRAVRIEAALGRDHRFEGDGS